MNKQDSIKQGVQQAAQALWDMDGKLTAKALVEAARDPENPAHDGFEWDNEKAGEDYRVFQARNWMRRIEIRREPDQKPERLVNVPRILSEDHGDAEGTYQVISLVIQHPDLFEAALNQAQQKMSAARRAVDDLYAAAEIGGRENQAALIAQMARATEMWSEALKAMN